MSTQNDELWDGINGRRKGEDQRHKIELIEAIKNYLSDPENENYKSVYENIRDNCSEGVLIYCIDYTRKMQGALEFIVRDLYEAAFTNEMNKAKDNAADHRQYIAKESEMVNKITEFIKEGKEEESYISEMDEKGREVNKRKM